MKKINCATDKNTEKKPFQDLDKDREWFAIQVVTLKEHVAKVNFENQRFEVYLPQILSVRRHARSVKNVKKAFFPGYLFIHLAPEERRWETIAGTRGVIRPVCFGKHYPPVPDWVIEDLWLSEDEKGFIPFEAMDIKPGDKIKVHITDGIEQPGIFKALRSNERALILLEILQRQVATEVPLSSFSPFTYC